MRRRDREITDNKAIENIILRSTICKLAMCDRHQPYVVPLCFGFKENTLYFHSASKGKKIDVLKKNPNVCFEFDILTQVIPSAKACKWGMKYKSVIGYGKASFVTDDDLKRQAFDIIMKQYADGSFLYEDASLKATVIIKVEIESMSGKQSDI
ncbi:MAG: pyridoxamine 5'-phosphate oxidase family protein [Desulfobacterales bacterium]|nr:MAG: pyridoxamine 5'-phosphate oxidase family protein [Desulfobacterales bacterium]